MSRTINYKEKYEKALKAIAELLDEGDREGLTIVSYRKDFEEIFSELKESEDERIRKEIIQSIKGSMIVIHKDKCLAWLKKVDEDNKFLKSIKVGDIITKTPDGILINLGPSDRALEHHDKVEPKFKVGDWIIGRATNNEPRQISEITDQYYKSTYGDQYGFSFEDEMHLWTIQDMKDGDMLCTYECGIPKIIFILKGTPKKHYALSYHCYYNIMYPHFDSDSEKGCLAPNEEDVKPATKEQHDLLFQKMKELGYEWDTEKKELKLSNPKITIGTKICLKTNPNVILNIISDDCHEDKFECSNGSVLSLKQIEKYYDIIK